MSQLLGITNVLESALAATAIGGINYKDLLTTRRLPSFAMNRVPVLEGELIDDRGRHGPGVLQVYPPDSSHELSSEKGCIFLVVWEKPVVPVQSTGKRVAA
jgi:hypothetical protein